MNTGPVVVHGRIRSDGTLELNQPLGLPPGEVEVTVQTVSGESSPKEDLLALMERIWAAQRARGFRPRTRDDSPVKI